MQAKSTVPQGGVDDPKVTHPRMHMQQMLDHQEQAKKESIPNKIRNMVNNLKKPSTQKSVNSQSYVEKVKKYL
ncbi:MULTISPECIES: hypothetical protein [spotted fever group]|uniref:Uncharacterized protein n=2 Tax=spotted fever group TaxID=114277 RepID=A0A510GD55_9RICK|nr:MULTISPECIES: hypothetical protein [spotted fever group]BBJ31949.1 hypothetical protein RAS_10580 [Rickettsia asiatica]